MRYPTGENVSTPQASQQHAGAKDRKSAAAYLSLSTRKLDELAANGELPRIKVGSKTLFRVQDLDAFLESKLNGGAA